LSKARPTNAASGAATSASARVGIMFGRIAGRYDLMNRVMTLGSDRRWRKLAVRVALADSAARVLDVGTGTGDMLMLAAGQSGVRRAVGVDLAPPMLQRARLRAASAGVTAGLALAGAASLPFRDQAFDALTTAFVLRNVPDLPLALAEMRRVLRPGGRLVCLEITRPRQGFRTSLFSLYFRFVVPVLGRVIAGDAEAYAYLPSSVDRFLGAAELSEAMRAAGFRTARFHYVGPGGVAVHLCVR
jgi:demethylmenaquinone methyltransferase/2-methoxy-6-polyprenyl-1,4-benzoquinol methylase